MAKKEILKGSYCLIIHLKPGSVIKIGKVGEIDFKSGYYVYVGSALNSLEGRLKRHLRNNKKLFWHIDYLLADEHAEILEILFSISEVKYECRIASSIGDRGIKINSFGCSDCKCDSHLFYFKDLKSARETCQKAFEKLNLKSENFKG